jgi:hypothetical protein
MFLIFKSSPRFTAQGKGWATGAARSYVIDCMETIPWIAGLVKSSGVQRWTRRVLHPATDDTSSPLTANYFVDNIFF